MSANSKGQSGISQATPARSAKSVRQIDVTSIRQRETELEKAIQERDAALAEVRTLRGLLPICSVCKSIRDENGTWQTIEQYVSDRSDASFTHGICPGCIARLYPDVDVRDIKPKR